MDFFIGTSGYAYPVWKGSFYPEKCPAKQMLPYYASQFRAVEINSTFYTPPETATLTGWAGQLPAGFRYALKAPQRITHFQRLKECDEVLEEFLATIKVLKQRRGPVLFQLPPNFKKDVPRLEGFLKLLPKSLPVTLEFRNVTWFDDEVFALLWKKKVALCIAENDDLQTPFVATADWGYLRLQLPEYTTKSLRVWAKLIQQQTWTVCHVYFMHEDNGTGPQFAKMQMRELGVIR